MSSDGEVYQGLLSKLSKDGTKYVVTCKEISEWYGVEARLPAAEKPVNVELGDAIKFSVTIVGGGAPVISWAERDGARCLENAMRKTERSLAPKAGELKYEGKIKKQCAKDQKMYVVDCPCVTSWFGQEARASSEVLFLAGAAVGDEIVFTLVPDKPVLAWAELRSENARKRPRGEAAADVAKGAAAPDAGDEVSRLRAELQAEKVARLEAQLAVALGGAAPAAAPRRPTVWLGDEAALAAASLGNTKPGDWTDDLLAEPAKGPQKDSSGKGKSRLAKEKPVATRTAWVCYRSPDEALSALALYGTELEGFEVQPEADTENPNVVKVLNLAPGLTEGKLTNHFQEAGSITQVTFERGSQKGFMGFDNMKGGKGANKGSGKGKDGKGFKDGKGTGAKSAPAALIGEVFFASAAAAEAALGLYGTCLAEAPNTELKVEPRAGSADSVRVLGIPPGTTSQTLRDHFAECGEIRAARFVKA